MKTIWKYPFPIDDAFTLTMPVGARIVSVQMQGDSPCLWALVLPHAPTKPRAFRLFGTGHPIDDRGLSYRGTFQMHDGRLVWHLFEKFEAP